MSTSVCYACRFDHDCIMELSGSAISQNIMASTFFVIFWVAGGGEKFSIFRLWIKISLINEVFFTTSIVSP